MSTEPTPHRSDDELLALVHRKATRIRHQRQLAALGASALVVLLLAGGIAIAGNGGGGNKRTIRAAGDLPASPMEPRPQTTTAISTSMAALAASATICCRG